MFRKALVEHQRLLDLDSKLVSRLSLPELSHVSGLHYLTRIEAYKIASPQRPSRPIGLQGKDDDPERDRNAN